MKKIFFLIIVAAAIIKTYGQVSVIVNASAGEINVKAEVLAKIYSQDVLKWPNGIKISLVDQSGGNPVKAKFYSYIKQDPSILKKEWLRKKVTGEAKPPIEAASDEEVIKIVASTPGAVGFVKSSSVTGNVKVITVIQ